MMFGFEPTTFRTWVSSHNHQTRAPPNRYSLCSFCFFSQPCILLSLSLVTSVSLFSVLSRNFSIELFTPPFCLFRRSVLISFIVLRWHEKSGKLSRHSITFLVSFSSLSRLFVYFYRLLLLFVYLFPFLSLSFSLYIFSFRLFVYLLPFSLFIFPVDLLLLI